MSIIYSPIFPRICHKPRVKKLELSFKKVWCDLDYVILCYFIKIHGIFNPLNTLQ